MADAANSVGSLSGKVALITGAGSGIGEASARLMAERGAAVGLLSRTAEEVEKLADDIGKRGGKAIALTADVTDYEALKDAFDTLAATFGGIDHVFANAGINGTAAPFEKLTPEDFDQVVKINLYGTFYTCHIAVPHLKRRKGASISITSSINGNLTYNDPGTLPYSSTKAAQVCMTKMLAVELARHGIRVNAILPGSIDTSIEENTEKRNKNDAGWPVEFPKGEIPLTGNKPGTSAQVARLAAFLASHEADHITGAEIVIDGAQGLVI